MQPVGIVTIELGFQVRGGISRVPEEQTVASILEFQWGQLLGNYGFFLGVE